jgi:hypothetical protein
MVSRATYWSYAMGVRQARRTWALRLGTGSGARGDEAAMQDGAAALGSALADGPRTVKELGSLATGFVGDLGLWVDLVRVPPSGTWQRRRADRLALADRWVGPPDVTEGEGRAFLVRAYLGAFGPAPWKDIGLWAGMSTTDVRGAGEGLALSSYRDATGRPLVDLAEAPIADGGAAAPVRFLPHWDASLLVHARRTGVLPEHHRAAVFNTRNPFSVGTVLVDGHVAATWSLRDGRIEVTELEPISAADRDAMEAERAALERFHA